MVQASSPTKVFRRGIMFVISSPSGAGKGTLSKQILSTDDNMKFSVSVTSRSARSREQEGRDYFFVSDAKFREMIKNNEFVEWASVFDHFYGTPHKLVTDTLALGHDMLLDIDWQGHRQLREKLQDDVVSIFILPPSIQELGNRLSSRQQDSQDIIDGRMRRAMEEINQYLLYDYILINDDLDALIEAFSHIIAAERYKRVRQLGLSDFIETLAHQHKSYLTPL